MSKYRMEKRGVVKIERTTYHDRDGHLQDQTAGSTAIGDVPPADARHKPSTRGAA